MANTHFSLSSWLDWDYGEEDHRGKGAFLSSISRVYTITIEADLDPLAEVMFVGFLHCKVPLSSHTTLFGRELLFATDT